MEPALRTIVERLLAISYPSRRDIDRIKFEVSREFGLSHIPGNSEIIKILKPEEKNILLSILRRKEARALSGVNVIAVMTKPRACPHGRCAYCPGGPDDGVPQSYTGQEPASMRGSQNNYDPYNQVKSRIEQLKAIGHDVDKVDLIVMGGTFPSSPRDYQESFILGCLNALNGIHSPKLSEAKTFAETAKIRNVGITVETRPDTLDLSEVKRLLGLGVTRVELGVQNIYDDVYKAVDRGHNVQDVINATRLLKDAGIKVCYHMMPGLPNSNSMMDLKGFKEIFENPDFRPDMIKIYPTLVLKGTKLYDWWKAGSYSPLTTETAIQLLADMKIMVPPWVRIMRVQRDIPATLIEAGVDKSNLRQLVQQELDKRGNRCKCIRCREVGHRSDEPTLESLEIKRLQYKASGGLEYFLSVEDLQDVLIGFLRLRISSFKANRLNIRPTFAYVRELHVYGQMVPVGTHHENSWQHLGWGKKLLEVAESITYNEHGIDKLLVTSALGTKEYYKNLGYEKDGPYVSKKISAISV